MLLFVFPLLFPCFLVSPSSLEESRIIGGDLSPPDRWPMVASLMHNGQHFCGGVVWNDRWIITAAHCLCREGSNRVIRPGPVSVYLGHTNLTVKDSEYIFNVHHIITHRYYNPINWANDIALIKLSRRIDFAREHIRVRCTCDPEPLEKLDLARCLAIGWGSVRPRPNLQLSNDLLQVELPVLSQAQCVRKRRSFNSHSHVCAMHPKGGKDACSGDSGGPLLCPLRGIHPPVYSLVGLTSFGSKDCGAKGHPGFYTRVNRFLTWIQTNTENY